MGKHEYRGVRAQRAMNLAAARREDRERINRVKYGYAADPGQPEFYPRSIRPTTPRRPQSAGLAMRSVEARDVGFVPGPTPDKPKETLRSTSWKYLHTCVGVMAAGMVGVGLLVGITTHWTRSKAGQAGIGLICGGVGLVVGVVIAAYIRLKHAKMQETRRAKKKAKADLEAGKTEGKKIQSKAEEAAQDVPMRPMSSRKKRKKKTEPEKEKEETNSYKESVMDETTSDSADIIPRSVSRTSMALQGSINMSAIPEDQEEEENDEGGTASSSGPTSKDKDLDTNSIPGVLVTPEEES